MGVAHRVPRSERSSPVSVFFIQSLFIGCELFELISVALHIYQGSDCDCCDSVWMLWGWDGLSEKGRMVGWVWLPLELKVMRLIWAAAINLLLRIFGCAEECDTGAENNGTMGVSVSP